MAFALLWFASMRFLVVSLVLAGSSAAWAAPLEALRATAQTANEKRAQLKATQLAKRAALSKVSAEIETLKTQSRGALLPGGELDAALKTSQELSTVLSTLAQQTATLEAEADAANLALERGLSDELKQVRTAFDTSTERATRLGHIATMRRLRAERATVRTRLPTAQLPGVEALKAADAQASDPEVWLEQAELLRDTEAKVAKEMLALDTRIAERREELALDRRVQRFLGEESMFDDQDRRLRLQRTTTLEATRASTPTAGSPAPNKATNFETTAGAASPPVGALGLEPKSDSNYAPQAAGAQGDLDSSGVRISNASDARPQVGSQTRLGDERDDIAELDAERARLTKLSEQLRGKAVELERRAAAMPE